MTLQNDTFEAVYDSVLGNLVEECRLSWVPDITYAGGHFDRAYGEMISACWRVCERLGKEEDPDVEQIRNAYEEMQKLLCRQMFISGAAYASMKNNSPVRSRGCLL